MVVLSARIRNGSQVRRRLGRTSRRVQDIVRDDRGVVEQIVLQEIDNRFDTETGPTGQAWEPRVEGRGAWPNQNNGGGLLDYTGRLRRSIGVAARGFEIGGAGTGFGFRVGVLGDVPYAGVHQSGGVSNLTGGRIPARPFLGITTTMVSKVIDYARGQLDRSVRTF